MLKSGVLLLLPLAVFGRTPVERLSRVEVVHQQRLEWAKQRVALPEIGVYRDYRAVFTHTPAPRVELVKAAKDAQAQIVFAAGTPGTVNGVLFLAPPKQTLEIYRRPPDADPDRWRLASRDKQYAVETYGAGTDIQMERLWAWERRNMAGPITAIADSDPADPLIFSRSIAFASTSTHILARDLKAPDVLESLAEGHAYIAYDWLCDPTGFSFYAQNDLGTYEMGDTVPMGSVAGAVQIEVRLPLKAKMKLLHEGIVVANATDTKLSYSVPEQGDYRLEAWLTVDGEDRPWIISNPIHVGGKPTVALPSNETAANVQVMPDIAYAPSLSPEDEEKHLLDLYLPKGKSGFPVVVFLHGGAWSSGDRTWYAFVGNQFAAAGIGVAIPSYRLMPRSKHPAQIEDAAAAFAWVFKNISFGGGNPNRIYLAGHSSGAHLAALLALDENYLKKHGVGTSAIRGVIALSGAYDVRNAERFLFDGDKADASPALHARAGAPPFLIAYSQWDSIGAAKQARDFQSALEKVSARPQMLYLPQETHNTEIIHFADGDGPLAKAVLKFVTASGN